MTNLGNDEINFVSIQLYNCITKHWLNPFDQAIPTSVLVLSAQQNVKQYTYVYACRYKRINAR